MLNKTILTLFIVKIGYWIVNKLINDNKMLLISLFYKITSNQHDFSTCGFIN